MTRALAAYPRRSTDKIRYDDTDRQGHVNNATFSTFLETGRVEVLYDPAHPVSDVGCEFVIARLVLEFRGEIQCDAVMTRSHAPERAPGHVRARLECAGGPGNHRNVAWHFSGGVLRCADR